MKHRYFLLLIIVALVCLTSHAKMLFPDSNTATNDVELGVEGISRLCPTGLWDHWTFRNIVYDKESNAVVFVIQLANWNVRRNGKEISEADAKKQTEWIVKNIVKGYESLKESPTIMCDGDFMLFLSLGTLLKQMEKDGATLRIMLLKPDYSNQVIEDIPLTLTPAELKPLIEQIE